MDFPQTLSEGQLLITAYLNQPLHYSFVSYDFCTCENFDDYCYEDNHVGFDPETRELKYVDPKLTYDVFFADLPFRYMLLTPELLLEMDFRVAANFMTALVDTFDIDDEKKKVLLANMLMTEGCPVFIKFKRLPRNIDWHPLNQKAIIAVSNLYNELPSSIRKHLEKVFSEENWYERD